MKRRLTVAEVCGGVLEASTFSMRSCHRSRVIRVHERCGGPTVRRLLAVKRRRRQPESFPETGHDATSQNAADSLTRTRMNDRLRLCDCGKDAGEHVVLAGEK